MAGYVISKNGGQNDPFWKDTDTVLKSVINDADMEISDDEQMVKTIYNVEKSTKYAEKIGSITSLPNMQITEEGEPAPTFQTQAGFTKLITHSTFTGQVVCTQEMKEDGMIDQMKNNMRNLVVSYKRTKAELATAAIVTEGLTYTFGGRTLDKTTADGLGLFSTAHIAKVSGIATQSNVFTNELGTTATMLYTLANIGRNFKNDSGQVVGSNFDTIMLPGNTPAMEDTIKKLVSSTLTVGSDYNDINTQKGQWKVIINKRWIAASGTYPYILMASAENKTMRAAMFYNRVGLDIMNDVDINTRNLIWNARARFSCGFNNWRAFILGGATAGTTLS